MAQTKSLKTEILERLDLRKGGKGTASANIRKASSDFAASNAPQFRGKSQKKRHQMAVAAGLSAARGESVVPKTGDRAIYEGKNVIVRSLSESGMAVVRFGNNREVIVRANSLKRAAKEQLNEGVIGIAAITPTWKEASNYGFAKIDLDPEDIGLIFEDDDSGEEDEQEENDDNGSNIRHDGHTGKKEVDELPTPSDTIAPAYSDEKPPKEISEPLSIQAGAEEEHLWDPPEWDGYDYPADAPEIPTAEFNGSDMGNSRAPHWTDERNAFDGQENREDGDHEDGDQEDESEEKEVDEGYMGFNKLEKNLSHKSGIRNPGAVAASIGRNKYGNKKFQNAAASGHKLGEGEVTDPARDEGQEHEELRAMRKDREFMGERQMANDEETEQKQKQKPKWQKQDRGRARQQKEKERSAWMDESALAERKPSGDEDEPQQKSKWQKQDRNKARQQKEKQRTSWMDESFNFMAEMDAMLDGDDTEPKSGDTITLTLPAMASIVCTVAHKVGHDHELLKAIVEALGEVSKGKTIDVDDLQAVADHVNGEEMPEIENREHGDNDHEGMEHDEHEDHEAEPWPGDGEPTGGGKTKLLGGVAEQADYFGGDDVMQLTRMTEDEEIELLRSRAFPNKVRR